MEAFVESVGVSFVTIGGIDVDGEPVYRDGVVQTQNAEGKP